MSDSSLLAIVQTGDPVLRMQAAPLTREQIRSTEIQELIEMMRATMFAAPGVGLAAPQIGKGIQLTVIEDSAERHSLLAPELLLARERDSIPFHVLINPKLTAETSDLVEFFEGCLSVDGYVALTPRYRHVKVIALNEHADEVLIKASGWYARILQHEIDHLNGTLYIDRMITQTFSTAVNKDTFWEMPPKMMREQLGLN
jgi:peptide deformylase